MLAKKMAFLFILSIISIFLSSCASTTAPEDWLSTAQEAQREAYGAWISVEYEFGSGSTSINGEFIAVGKDTVFVLTQSEAEDVLIGIPLSLIKRSTLATYDAKHGVLGLWTLGGSLSTASHGVGLLISLPIWILLGSIATVGQSYTPIEKFPVKSWDELEKYARFPQGLPKELNREKLRRKWKLTEGTWEY